MATGPGSSSPLFRALVTGLVFIALGGCVRGPELYVSGGERSFSDLSAPGGDAEVGRAAGATTGEAPVRPEAFPPLPGDTGDGVVNGMGRWNLEASGDRAPWEPVRVGVGQMAEGGCVLTVEPGRGTTAPIRLTRRERERLLERLGRVPRWQESCHQVPVCKEWILQKSNVSRGEGGKRRRVEIAFVSVGSGRWQGVRIDIREEVNRGLVNRQDLLISAGESADLRQLLER